MARDNYYCFMCGRYETDWFFRQPESKLDGMDFNDCDVVPIIKREIDGQLRCILKATVNMGILIFQRI